MCSVLKTMLKIEQGHVNCLKFTFVKSCNTSWKYSSVQLKPNKHTELMHVRNVQLSSPLCRGLLQKSHDNRLQPVTKELQLPKGNKSSFHVLIHPLPVRGAEWEQKKPQEEMRGRAACMWSEGSHHLQFLGEHCSLVLLNVFSCLADGCECSCGKRAESQPQST